MKAQNNNNFMTEKEKQYVEYCLKRSINYSHNHTHYSTIFSLDKQKKNGISMEGAIKKNLNMERKKEKKIEPEEVKKILNDVLVKTTKKSKKIPRYKYENQMLPSDISKKLKLEEINDILIKFKYFENSRDQINEIPCIIREHIRDFVQMPKFYSFLSRFFSSDADESLKRLVISYFYYNVDWIKATPEFKNFINNTFQLFPKIEGLEDDSFFHNIKNIATIMLASVLILNNPEFSTKLYEGIIENPNQLFNKEIETYSWQFLALLMEHLNVNQRKNVIVTFRDQIIDTSLSNDKERIEHLELFLNSLGMSHSELI
ncbi:hypothetical protein TCON_0622 [Astathelohania contejeani]|uniref:Uncharacterized protein n=1 Tax=Astathelohania contejeani TaxID=164912 RepID=A0ABQ7I182_9MICR|nr:hypothetical protein TCON_0622 [Thelohania contejeani]